MIDTVIQIKEVKQGSTAKGGEMRTIVSEGEKIKPFKIFPNDTYWDFFAPAMWARVKLEKNDTGYWNLQVAENVPEEIKKIAEQELDEEQVQKIRMSALLRSTEIHVARINQGKTATPADVVATAIIFESYINNGGTVSKPAKDNPAPEEDIPY